MDTGGQPRLIPGQGLLREPPKKKEGSTRTLWILMSTFWFSLSNKNVPLNLEKLPERVGFSGSLVVLFEL